MPRKPSNKAATPPTQPAPNPKVAAELAGLLKTIKAADQALAENSHRIQMTPPEEEAATPAAPPEEEPHRRPRRPRRDHYPAMLVPILDAFDQLGIGVTSGYKLMNSGAIQTVYIGQRRYATRESIERIATQGTPINDSEAA
jgi:hypothetical protein